MSSISAPMSPQARGLRIAEYSVYPRTARDHCVHEGFTRDESGAEIVLVTRAPEDIGELLRVRIQGLETQDRKDTLARVARCSEIDESRFELQLQALEAHAPRKARRGRQVRGR